MINGRAFDSKGVKIINECKQYKIPAPIFKFEPSGFWLEMNTGKKTNVTRMSPEMDDRIVGLLMSNNTITIDEISEIISANTVEWLLHRNANKTVFAFVK